MSVLQRNGYLSKVCAAAAMEDPYAAIEHILQQYRKHGETLPEIAARCGVQEVLEEPLPFDGGIFEARGGQTIIKLNSHAHHSRKRFTLAHEVGHLVLASATTARCALSCRRSLALERTCNMIAAELIMPAAKVRAAVSELKPSSPESLRALAARFNVSLQAAAVRVRELGLWKRSIGMWRFESSVPSRVWFVGRCPWGNGDPTFAAFDAARDSNQTVRGLDVTRRGEFVEPISLELLNIGADYILGLVGAIS